MALCAAFGAYAQTPEDAALQEKMAAWNEAKLGMFVHWGPYCLYGGVYNGFRQNRGGAEWIMNRCKIPFREYRAKASTFNPVEFSADSLVLLAKNAGARYLVITSKHHDGFAMFKSDASNFNIVDYTPYKRDIVDEVAQACRRHGVKLGLYYSQSQDWCNPGGNEARKLMKEGWANPDSLEIDRYTQEHGGSWDALQQTKTFDEYFHEVALPQIKELLDRYGNEMGMLFFDTPQRITDSQAAEVMELLKPYPHIVVNDRLKRPNYPGDYKTPEGRIPKEEDIDGVFWETCMNIGSSWGYKSWENAWKSSEEIIRNLVTIASRGGNYLLNVGPDALGNVPDPACDRLADLGRWLSVNGEAIYGSVRSHIAPEWGRVTRVDGAKTSTLYLCVFDWPADGKLRIKCPCAPKAASMLADGTALRMSTRGGETVIDLPAQMPDKIATVVKLELRRKLPHEQLMSNTQKVFKIVDAD